MSEPNDVVQAIAVISRWTSHVKQCDECKLSARRMALVLMAASSDIPLTLQFHDGDSGLPG